MYTTGEQQTRVDTNHWPQRATWWRGSWVL